MRDLVNTFRNCFGKLFGPNVERDINMFKFPFLGHPLNNLKLFWKVQVPRTSPYDYFNFIVKQSYENTSNRSYTRIKYKANASDTNLTSYKVIVSTVSQTACSNSLRRNRIFRSWGQMLFNSFLTFKANGKDYSSNNNLFLHSLFNSFTSDVFIKLVELLKDSITNMKRPPLHFMG